MKGKPDDKFYVSVSVSQCGTREMLPCVTIDIRRSDIRIELSGRASARFEFTKDNGLLIETSFPGLCTWKFACVKQYTELLGVFTSYMEECIVPTLARFYESK